jgi:hypothetical protein
MIVSNGSTGDLDTDAVEQRNDDPSKRGESDRRRDASANIGARLVRMRPSDFPRYRATRTTPTTANAMPTTLVIVIASPSTPILMMAATTKYMAPSVETTVVDP